MNGDGVSSAGDLWLAVVWIFQLPGNFIVDQLLQYPQTAQTLGLDATACGGWTAAIISAVCWLIALQLYRALLSRA